MVSPFVTKSATKTGVIVTIAESRPLSQPLASVWLTYHLNIPATEDEGVGALVLPIPPVAVLYHKRFVPVAFKVRVEAPSQYWYVSGSTMGNTDLGLTNTFICARGPSQLLTVWLTYHELEPGVVVKGTGAVALPVPPVAAEYHNRFVPIADSGAAVAPSQRYTQGCTVRAGGVTFTTTVVLPGAEIQPFTVNVAVYIPDIFG